MAAGEAAVRGPHHTAVAHHHAFGAEQCRLAARVTGDQPSVAAHHTPPGQLDVGRCEQRPDGARRTGATGVVGDVAVADHLARAEPGDHRDDLAGQRGHRGRSTSPRPHRAWAVAGSSPRCRRRCCGTRRRSRRSGTRTSPPSGAATDPEAGGGVERHDHAVHGTILEIGSSSRSVAPASDRAGMIRLIVRLSTTLSTANPPLASFDTVGDLADGRTASTAS